MNLEYCSVDGLIDGRGLGLESKHVDMSATSVYERHSMTWQQRPKCTFLPRQVIALCISRIIEEWIASTLFSVMKLSFCRWGRGARKGRGKVKVNKVCLVAIVRSGKGHLLLFLLLHYFLAGSGVKVAYQLPNQPYLPLSSFVLHCTVIDHHTFEHARSSAAAVRKEAAPGTLSWNLN